MEAFLIRDDVPVVTILNKVLRDAAKNKRELDSLESLRK